jgi:hypothetical protein
MTLIVACSVAAGGQADQTEVIWDQFSADLMAGRITADRIRPYFPEFREPAMRVLEHFRQSSRPEDWKAKPELHRVGNEIHGIIALTEAGGKKVPYCFSLLVENSQWYFEHVEAIFVRLDEIGPLPASRFPDVSEGQKAWMRDEPRVIKEIKVFNLLAKEKGRDFALDFFRDGVGYALQARTWVPFVSPERAFVLFLCWEQANLFVSPVTLQALDDNSAVIQLQPRWFQLYRQVTNLPQMISEAEYRNIFETTWQDRARAAGWNLQIDYTQDQVVFRLKH